MACRKTENIINSIAVKRLKKIAPEDYQFAKQVAIPTITDTTLIPVIIRFVIGQGYLLNGENAPFILAVVFKLTAEYKLYYQNMRLSDGVRDVISNAMNYRSPEMISMAGATVVSYYKGNWAKKVDDMANEFLKTISQADEKH